VLVADLISGVSPGLKLTIIDHFLYVRSLLIGRLLIGLDAIFFIHQKN
jgi:F0F1-type ATP synthase assembly protein I